MSEAPELFDTTGCLCLAARRASRAITREFDRALRAHGLRATQFSLLSALALSGGMRISDLADLLCAERTTLTRNLAVAEQQGLVQSAVGTDGRERILSISTKGRRVLNRAVGTWQTVQERITEQLGKSAADSLRRLSGGPSTFALGKSLGKNVSADSIDKRIKAVHPEN